MAGLKGKSGPPGNMNPSSTAAAHSETARGSHSNRTRGDCQAANYGGLNSGQGLKRSNKHSHQDLAEVIASDASWLMVFNGAIDHIIQNIVRLLRRKRGSHCNVGFNSR